MIFIGIDPGPTDTAVVFFNAITGKPEEMYFGLNAGVREFLREKIKINVQSINCEMIASYGMAVGKSIFETCLFIGELREYAHLILQVDFHLIYRREIKIAFCGTCRAKDTNVRQYLLDRFPATGGGKCPQVGTKKQPGPLFGVKQDLWSALAVSVYAADLVERT